MNKVREDLQSIGDYWKFWDTLVKKCNESATERYTNYLIFSENHNAAYANGELKLEGVYAPLKALYPIYPRTPDGTEVKTQDEIAEAAKNTVTYAFIRAVNEPEKVLAEHQENEKRLKNLKPDDEQATRANIERKIQSGKGLMPDVSLSLAHYIVTQNQKFCKLAKTNAQKADYAEALSVITNELPNVHQMRKTYSENVSQAGEAGKIAGEPMRK